MPVSAMTRTTTLIAIPATVADPKADDDRLSSVGLTWTLHSTKLLRNKISLFNDLKYCFIYTLL